MAQHNDAAKEWFSLPARAINPSDIRALTKPHISEYSFFRLLLNSEDRRRCSATASVLGIPSAEYTIGVKERLLSRQV